MDLATIRLEVRERLHELDENFFSDDEVDRAINEAVRKFCSEERWEWLWTEWESDLTGDDNTLTLPADVPPNRVFNMSLNADSIATPVMVERVQPRAGFRLKHHYDGFTGVPRWYYIAATNLSEDEEPPITYTAHFVPTPDIDYDVAAQYLMVPSLLGSESEEPPIPEEYQDAIPAWAAGKLFLKELQISAKASEQFSIYIDILQRAKAEQAKANVDEVLAWGRQHPLNTQVSERDFVLGRVPATGLG